MSKKCGKCQTLKSTEAFYKSVSKKDGFQDYCKECQKTKSLEYQRKHKERASILNKEYRLRNPDKVTDWDRNAKVKRRRLLKGAEFEQGITLDEIYIRDKGICQLCKIPCLRPNASIDHRIPISKGGSHTRRNVQLAHFSCNSIKRDKMPEFEVENGR